MKRQVLDRAMRYSSNLSYSKMDLDSIFRQNPVRWTMVADKAELMSRLPELEAKVGALKEEDTSETARLAKIVLTLTKTALERLDV